MSLFVVFVDTLQEGFIITVHEWERTVILVWVDHFLVKNEKQFGNVISHYSQNLPHDSKIRTACVCEGLVENLW